MCSGLLAGNHSKVCPTGYWPLVKAQLWIETDGGGKSQKVAGLNHIASKFFDTKSLVEILLPTLLILKLAIMMCEMLIVPLTPVAHVAAVAVINN